MAAISFTPPLAGPAASASHHADAAAGNIEATTRAIEALDERLDGRTDTERILLRAAAGAGKSYALRRMVVHACRSPQVKRVGVVAFANKQVFPLAEAIGSEMGRNKVCLLVAADREPDLPVSVKAAATVVTSIPDIPLEAEVIVSTTHKVGGWSRKSLRNHLGMGENGTDPYDILFIDEAWQLALHRYRAVEGLAPLCVGVGDVGQLPPLDPGENPWRGDSGYNPYRAWPTQYEDDARTVVTELPSVWRPTAAQLPLWRAFYPDWDSLDCVAAPGDRSMDLPNLRGAPRSVWQQVASGVPTLVEVAGLTEPDAPDVDLPLLEVVESWLDPLLRKGFATIERCYDAAGSPDGEIRTTSASPDDGHLIAVLATRNQAVDDAQDMVDRLTDKHGLAEGVITASTVDSWQGRTNALTVAIHPLSGAGGLDAFNSAFGRLAVTCTRATHGLLMVSRSGLTDLLATAPARPGTPLGEPGTRQLPRQTHQRILRTFARATFDAGQP